MERPRSSSNMPYLSIEEQRGKIVTPGFAILKDGKPMAFAMNIMDARMIKLACEDWYLRNKRPENV